MRICLTRASMAFLSPAPSMRVVSSLVLSTFLTRPSSFRVTFSSVRHVYQQITDRADFLVAQENIGIFEQGALLFGVVDEVRREVAAVELHALDELELVLERLAVLDGDHSLFADLFHGVRDDLADLAVQVGRDRSDLRDFLGRVTGPGDLLQLLDHGGHRLVDAALEVHRVHSRGDVFHPLAHDRLRKHGRGGGAVTGHVRCLGGDFLHHLGPHVLEPFLELDLLGYGHAVLRDGRRAPGALQHHVSASRAERNLHCVGQDVQAMDHSGPCVFVETYVFGGHCCPSTTPRMSSSRMTRSSSPFTLTVCPEYFPNSTRSPTLTSSGTSCPSSVLFPLPFAVTSPWSRFSAAVSGMTMPDAVFFSSSRRLTITRSCNGRIFMMQRRSCGKWSWKPHRYQPEEFRQPASPGSWSLLRKTRGYRRRRFPCRPTNSRRKLRFRPGQRT